MESLVPHPEFKMLGLRNIPQMSENSLAYSTFTWPGLIKHLRQMLIANAKMEEGKRFAGTLQNQSLLQHTVAIQCTAFGSLLAVQEEEPLFLDSRNFSVHTQLLPPLNNSAATTPSSSFLLYPGFVPRHLKY